MSDPLRTPAVPDSPEREPDRDARIEALLLAGLDHFVSGEYEQALNVWTRVSFLDRTHARARAYTERARQAIAERQRESDELLHLGMDAFERGDREAARDLISRAVADIGPNDLASALLSRLSRLQTVTPDGAPALRLPPSPETAAPMSVAPRRQSGTGRVTWPAAVAGVGLAGLLAGGLLLLSSGGDAPLQADGVQMAPAEPLPVVRGAELDVERARTLFAGGHLRDALATLDAADQREPMRADVRALRADIQQRILEPRARLPEPMGSGGTP